MTVKIKLTANGISDLVHQLGQVPAGTETAVRRIVTGTAMQVQADVKKSVQTGPKTGRVYNRGRGRYHQASAPGEAPATDTGTLASRIYQEANDGGMSASVFSDVDYAGTLERGGGKIAPRPYFGPALDKNAQNFVNALENAVRGVVTKK